MASQKNFPAAMKAYEKALAIDNYPLLAIKLHLVQTHIGDVKAADARLLKWLDANPSESMARAYLADFFLATKRNKPAIEQYELIVQKDPSNALALNNLANLYQRENDPRSLQTAERAYQLKPDAPAIADTLGWILISQGNTARGLALLEKAASQPAKSQEIQYHFAVALSKAGDDARAKRELERLLETGQYFPSRGAAEALLKQMSDSPTASRR